MILVWWWLYAEDFDPNVTSGEGLQNPDRILLAWDPNFGAVVVATERILQKQKIQ